MWNTAKGQPVVSGLEVASAGASSVGTALRSSRVSISTDRKSTRLNSSHGYISYAVFCLKKKTRSRSQPSILTFLAQDAAGRAFCYSNANLRKGEEAEEIFNFISFWKRTHGELPRHVVFDTRLTTYANLARLDRMGISFITLRRRSPQLLKEIVLLPRSAWRTIELDVPTRKYRTPRVFEQKVSLAGATFRQLFIQDLGHDEPTILLTNQLRLSTKQLITRYAQRMLIENALSDA